MSINVLVEDIKNELHQNSSYRVKSIVSINGERIVFKASMALPISSKKEFFAIKAVRLDPNYHYTSTPSDQRSAEIEIGILKSLSSIDTHPLPALHNHIVYLYDVLYTQKYVFLVTEWCDGGDLFSYLFSILENKSDALSNPKEIQKMGDWFHELALSVSLVHQRGLAHRDLSPENVLLCKSKTGTHTTVKLHDFGLACTSTWQTKAVGKLKYAAPELYNVSSSYDPRAADIWSLGIIFFSMMSKHVPMSSARECDLHFQAFKKNPAGYVDTLLNSKKLKETMSHDAKDLFLRMTNVNPVDRLTIEQVLQHPFMYRHQLRNPVPNVQLGNHYRQENSPTTLWGSKTPQRVREKVHQTMKDLAGVMLKTTKGNVA